MNKNIRGTRTEKNLLASFAGESQARNRYTFFAAAAKKEGYEQISAIFTETAENEISHAKKFFRFLEGGMVEITASYPAGVIGTTKDNLRAAAEGEHEEYTRLYPEAAKIAEEEGFKEVAAAFRAISVVERQHEQRFLALMKNIEDDTVFTSKEPVKWKCRKCGYVAEGIKAPDKCPACGHPKAYFQRKEENY
ncbi:MAG: rubrerythrin family protein [Nitrospirae bacterium]|nr:rubrerythrin family protein [Nitrospirota bacterium]